MNKKLITLIIAFGLTTIVSAETIHTTVNGMVCAFCATGMEKSFGKSNAAKDQLFCLLAAAVFAAVAFLVVVHGAVLASLFAARLVCRESCRANRCRQNRKQDLRVILHTVSYVE